MTGSWKGRGNQYIQFARVVYCKLPTNGICACMHAFLSLCMPILTDILSLRMSLIQKVILEKHNV